MTAPTVTSQCDAARIEQIVQLAMAQGKCVCVTFDRNRQDGITVLSMLERLSLIQVNDQDRRVISTVMTTGWTDDMSGGITFKPNKRFPVVTFPGDIVGKIAQIEVVDGLEK